MGRPQKVVQDKKPSALELAIMASPCIEELTNRLEKADKRIDQLEIANRKRSNKAELEADKKKYINKLVLLDEELNLGYVFSPQHTGKLVDLFVDDEGFMSATLEGQRTIRVNKISRIYR